ncbi:MAG: AEC family transporter [Bacillota bacterium]|nr:AEC family transporter [Bacillota bacterium]
MSFTLLAIFNVAVMFILIAAGSLSYRLKLTDYDGAKQFANILTNVVSPCLILTSFQIDFDKSLAVKIAAVAVIAVLMHVVGIVLGKFAFRKVPYSSQCVYRHSSFMPNCGYMTLPLANALLGNVGVIYISIIIAVMNIFTWTYGLQLYSGENAPISVKKAILNPGVLSLFVAIPIFIFSVRFPPIINAPLKSIASINSPLAMITTGIFIAHTGVKSIFRDKYIYIVILLRQFLIPGITGAVMFLIMYLGGPVDNNVFMASMLAAAAPVAVASSMFAARCNADVGLASNTMAASTLTYIFSISVMVFLSSMVLGI